MTHFYSCKLIIWASVHHKLHSMMSLCESRWAQEGSRASDSVTSLSDFGSLWRKADYQCLGLLRHQICNLKMYMEELQHFLLALHSTKEMSLYGLVKSTLQEHQMNSFNLIFYQREQSNAEITLWSRVWKSPVWFAWLWRHGLSAERISASKTPLDDADCRTSWYWYCMKTWRYNTWMSQFTLAVWWYRAVLRNRANAAMLCQLASEQLLRISTNSVAPCWIALCGLAMCLAVFVPR